MRWILVAAFGLVGCSLMSVYHVPTSVAPGAPLPNCTESRFAPTVDFAFAGAATFFAVMLGIGASAASNSGNHDDARRAAEFAIGSGIVALPFFGSGIYGRVTSRCRKLHAEAMP